MNEKKSCKARFSENPSLTNPINSQLKIEADIFTDIPLH